MTTLRKVAISRNVYPFLKDANYATTLVKHSMNDIQWEPGDPSDDLLVLRLDTGTYDIINSIDIERMAKAWLK